MPRSDRIALAACMLAAAAGAQGPSTVEGTCQRGAGLESLGLATGGAAGLLELAVEGAPAVGLPFHLAVRHGVPGAPGVVVFGAKESALFVPDFGVTAFPSMPFVLELPFTLDAEGASPPLFEQLPVAAALCGAAYVVQAAAADPSAAGGASFTKALRLRFGGASGEALFGPGAPAFPIGPPAWDAEVGDFDGDQRLDLALTGYLDGGFDEVATVLFGTGDGTLGHAQALPTGNPFAASIGAGDVDGDGVHDVVTSAGSSASTGGIVLLQADGAGGFLPPAMLIQEPSSADVAVADVNADGQPDLVYTRGGGLGCSCDDVRVLLGAGAGAFLPPGTFPVDRSPVALTLADLDRDGALDVATANLDLDGASSLGSVSVLMGAGDGTFGPHQTLHTETPAVGINQAERIASADFALDGFVDLAALVKYGSGEGSVCLFRGEGGGAFAGAANHAAGIGASDLDVADVDRDLLPDAILGLLDDGGGVEVLRSAGDGTLLSYVAYDVGFDAKALVTGDFDGDLLPDVALVDFPESRVAVVLNRLLP